MSAYHATDNDLNKKNILLKMPKMIPMWINLTKLYLSKLNLHELPENFGALQVNIVEILYRDIKRDQI